MHAHNLLVGLACKLILAIGVAASAADRPNVILIITDDQGYGDIHAHGNSMIQTPHMDALYADSVRLTDFHVDPTCSPTRSALMTGRYSTRTGVWHTIMGRSLMDSGEVTVAEVFQAAGYRTAMFGKWHLGDNAPCRPQDQGFDHVFCHGGGGVGQTPDYFGNDYFDDTYFLNADTKPVQGYCTDVWFDAAEAFIADAARGDHPFFVYLSTNAPHGPFHVADKYADPYRGQGVSDSMSRFYGMITNIDENLGALRGRLQELGIAENTLLIFMTDNGTAAGARRAKGREGGWNGFNAGMRGAKGSAYDGGHRVPCFVHWPQRDLKGGHDVDLLTAHIDLLPTLANLCDLKPPADVELDGMDLTQWLLDPDATQPDRTLFVHSQRIEHPKKWKTCSVMTSRWRLVNRLELYDLQQDPGQSRNVADKHPQIVEQLRAEYETWWQSLKPKFSHYVRIDVGNESQNPSTLTAHDWHTSGGPVPWNHGHIRRGIVANGFWAITVRQPGTYVVTLRRWPAERCGPLEATGARLKIGELEYSRQVKPEQNSVSFDCEFTAGATKLQTWLTSDSLEDRGAYYVSVQRK